VFGVLRYAGLLFCCNFRCFGVFLMLVFLGFVLRLILVIFCIFRGVWGWYNTEFQCILGV